MKRALLLFASSCAWLSTEPYTASRDMKLYVTIDSKTSGTHVIASMSTQVDRIDLGYPGSRGHG